MAFKVGDRVRYRYDGVPPHIHTINSVAIGTVVVYDAVIGSIGVEFDEFIDGHSCNGYAQYGYGWNLTEHDLELVKKGNTIGQSFLEFNWPC